MFSYFIKLLMLMIFTSLVNGNGVYYENPTVGRCPSKHYSCCIISNCQASWSLLREGKRPEVCGWLNRTPLVCCPHYTHQDHHYVHNPHYIEEEPPYVPQSFYIHRPPSTRHEIPQIYQGTPSTLEITPSTEENLPYVGYLPSTVILPTETYLPSHERKLPSIRYFSSGGKTSHSVIYLPSGEKRLPSSERILPPIRDLPSRGRIIPPIRDLHFSGRRLPPRREEIPSQGDLPSSERWLPITREEIPSQGDLPSSERWLPSSDRRLPPTRKEIPSEEDLPSSERRLPTTGERTPLNDGNIPSSERGQPINIENSTSVSEMRPQPRAEGKLLKISPSSKPSSSDCGRRVVDRSSDVPLTGIRTIDTGATNFTNPGGFRITVVGGARTDDKWSWMAGIYNRNGAKPFCGGSVIDNRHILTAAHCFRSLEASQYTVKVGQVDITESSPSLDIEEIKTHENYQPSFYYDDIAIIRLKESLPFNTVSVCLPEEDNLNHGDNVTVLGWGLLSVEGGRTSNALQQADGIPIVRNEDCNVNYANVPSSLFPNGITDSMICAGLPEGGIDACGGDSGGPLLREFTRDRWALVGVVSFGVGCGDKRFPGVYTRVTNYLSWLTEYIDGKMS